MSAPHEPTYLSVPDAARYCGVSRNTLYTWVRQGKLGAYQTPGRTNRIRPADLVRFMSASGLFVPPGLADLAREDEKRVARPAVSPLPSPTAMHLLAVDDDHLMRSLHARALQELGRVSLAETGFEALHLLTLHADISHVVLDLRMPGQHGLRTFREIRTLRPELPVVVVTGFPDDWNPGPAGSRVEVLTKPFTPEALRDAVRRAGSVVAAGGGL